MWWFWFHQEKKGGGFFYQHQKGAKFYICNCFLWPQVRAQRADMSRVWFRYSRCPALVFISFPRVSDLFTERLQTDRLEGKVHWHTVKNEQKCAHSISPSVFVCVCVCICVWDRKWVCVCSGFRCVCMPVCVWYTTPGTLMCYIMHECVRCVYMHLIQYFVVWRQPWNILLGNRH